MKHVEDIFKHPAMVIAALVIAIVSGIANIKFSTDPAARPKAFTSDDGSSMRVDLSSQIQENRDDVDTLRRDLKAFREEQVRNTLLIQQLVNKVK